MNEITGAIRATAAGQTHRWLLGLFVVALSAHFYLTTRNWTAGFMPGHEFRQTHTAIIARYIDRENNFGPVYTVPLYGKPWVSPMEFPIYEWAVVLLSRGTGWPHHVSARTVSLACFYLMLPAAWLLLGQLGLARRQRYLPMALIVCCPVYIFYSRSFLMESMTLMGGVWFVALFVRTMRERRVRWAVLCGLAGALSGLVKSTTFFAWLVPAAAYGAWRLWADWRDRRGAAAAGRTMAWGLGTAFAPCAAVWWWVKFSDAIKEAHPSAYIFASKYLTTGNFGIADWAGRVAPSTWQTLFARWAEAIVPAWVILPVIALGLVFARAWRRRILGLFALFLTPQLLFPYAYAYQEYYFYACAVFVLAGLGCVGVAVIDSRFPPAVKALVALALPVALAANYARVYHELQSLPSPGGTGLTAALRAFTVPDSVLIVIGDDWSPIVPYYADRKALMVRNGLERDPAYLDRAFADLAGEKIGALVMMRTERSNRELARKITARFGLDREPTFSHRDGDAYLPRESREPTLRLLQQMVASGGGFEGVTTTSLPDLAEFTGVEPIELPPEVAAAAFSMVSPAPVKYRSKFGYMQWSFRSGVLGMHADADLWVPIPPGARRVICAYGILPTAYEREGDRTNGVEFILAAEAEDGSRRELFRRLLDPASRSADRGLQTVELAWDGGSEERLVLMTRSNGGEAFDWSYVERLEIR